ncbi:hypothetical protein P12x_000486 [Tundrisphaera lichenicola]|uniref:hypothetical protein n=1 Tax=Tundrisphaera lichenicola TaxID=2029860 RepID=UPI003EB7A792
MSIDSDQSVGRPGFLSRPISARAILAWLDHRKLHLAIGVGIVLRLIQYAHHRQYWMDEASLVANIQNLSPRAMFGPLENSQLAPPGFLFAEWVVFRIFGDHRLAFRLIPLLSGIASLFLIAAVARRVLAPGAVWIAVALFAVSGDLIYFASEAKQYSSDIACALGCLLMALTVGSRPLTAKGTALLAMAGSAVLWFSHPSIFVLAAVGVVGLSRSVGGFDWRSAAAWVGVGLAWVGSFACVHYVAMEQLDHRPMMWSFWAFAFPPMPPRSVWDATWAVRRLALIFVDPLNFDGPFDRRLSMLPAIGLFSLGAWRIGKGDRGRLALLMLPGGFALLASCLKLYPFHGRLILFFVPSILLGIAEGLDRVREVRGRGWLYQALLMMVLGVPALSAAYHAFEPIDRDNFNPYGDLRPSTLDPIRFPF